MEYSIDTSWHIGRALQLNPVASLGAGFMTYLLLMLAFGIDFSNAGTFLRIFGFISIIVVPLGVAGTLGFYLWGLYYQYAIKRDYGPKTLEALIYHFESKSEEIFDIETIARSNNEPSKD